MAEKIRAGRIRWIRGTYEPKYLRDAFLAVAATDDESLNESIARDARGQRILTCDASSAERSDLIFGALLTRDDVTVAVFTGGRDPALARKTRDAIAAFLSKEPDERP